MIRKLKEIAEAWLTAANPSDKQKKLAEERYNICLKCPHRKHRNGNKILPINTEYCDQCGCPLSKKIFSREYSACPMKKWEDIDNIYFNVKSKTTKTIL
jgi:hypothetical protein